MRCCANDEGRPFGAALRGEASNRHMLRWLKTVVVSDVEKASLEASGGDQEGECKRIADDVSKTYSDGIKTGGADMAPGQIWRIPVYWPGGNATQPKLILVPGVCRSVVFCLVAGMIAAYGRQWRGGWRAADRLGVAGGAGLVRAPGCG